MTHDTFDQLRLPPQNLDAERGVLGSVCLLPAALDDIHWLPPDAFYSDAHQEIYRALQQMRKAGTAIDIVTMVEALQKGEKLEGVGGAAYLAEVLDAVPHAAHVRYYAKIVHHRFLQRKMIYAATEILQSAYNGTVDETDLQEFLSDSEKKIMAVRGSVHTNAGHEIGHVLQQGLTELESRISEEGSGLSTGFEDLDMQLGFLQPSELVILAARPSMGKTALVCNIAERTARQGNRVLFFSLEQSDVELTNRMLSAESQVDGQMMRIGNLGEIEMDRLVTAASKLSGLPIRIFDDPVVTMAWMAAECRREHARSPVGLVIVDYLQLIEPEDRRVQRDGQIEVISRQLKQLAKELKAPVLALSQLNRAVENRNVKRPQLSDLRGSGAIEQDADIVIFLHRQDYYDPEDRPGEAEVIVEKARGSATGIVRLTWRKELLRFENMSAYSDTPFLRSV